jgi:large subunit ribosomal protein L4
MANVSVYNMGGQEVGTIEVSDSVFGAEIKENLVHLAVVQHLAAMRQGTQKAKTRSEVSGGGRKPWRQKGTGHARQGSTRAPQWTHGGVVFAPKPRSYRFTVNKKVRRLAMKSAFSTKAAANEIVVVDTIALDEYKTKKIAAMLKAIEVEKKALIVLDSVDSKVIKSAANIPGVKTAQVNTLNVYDILNADKLVIAKGAVSKIEEVYA